MEVKEVINPKGQGYFALKRNTQPPQLRRDKYISNAR
jgi:hypothetical protein